MARQRTARENLTGLLWPIAFVAFVYLAYRLGWLEWFAHLISKYLTDGILKSTANLTTSP